MKNFELKYLTETFYFKYPKASFPEIEHKAERPYIVFLVKIESNTFAIPFRTNMNHKYGYRFRNTDRETSSSTGLDFTKAVVINDSNFIGNDARIDDKEYLELSKKYFFIQKQFEKYVSNYRKFISNELNEYQRKAYNFSTLKYFHKELGIE